MGLNEWILVFRGCEGEGKVKSRYWGLRNGDMTIMGTKYAEKSLFTMLIQLIVSHGIKSDGMFQRNKK